MVLFKEQLTKEYQHDIQNTCKDLLEIHIEKRWLSTFSL